MCCTTFVFTFHKQFMHLVHYTFTFCFVLFCCFILLFGSELAIVSKFLQWYQNFYQCGFKDFWTGCWQTYMCMPSLNFKRSGLLKICSACIKCNPKWHSVHWFQIYITRKHIFNLWIVSPCLLPWRRGDVCSVHTFNFFFSQCAFSEMVFSSCIHS